MDRLSDSYRLIYYDQRGRGKSRGNYNWKTSVSSNVSKIWTAWPAAAKRTRRSRAISRRGPFAFNRGGRILGIPRVVPTRRFRLRGGVRARLQALGRQAAGRIAPRTR